ncbi:phage tail tip lysozyme [Peptoniphilus sp. HCN-40583]|uniref:phage tail tip lysozyme n=1 Tax=Peptoniphilus sp. HCN-40583 TaxID=3134662 RepID=UPI0030BABE86
MSKDVRIRVSADTNAAKKEIEDLNKRIKQVGKMAVGSQKTVGKIEMVSTEETDFSEAVDQLGTDIKGLIQAIDRLSKNTKGPVGGHSTGQNAKSTSPPLKTKDSKANVPENNSKFLEKIGAAIGAAKYAQSYASAGASQAKSLDSESMRLYGRLNYFGSDFTTPRRELGKIGRRYGYDYDESFEAQRSILRGGFKDNESLALDTESAMRMSRAYGIDSSILAEGFNAQVKRGAFGQGNMSEYLNIQAAATEKNGMKGREEEQVRSLNQIAETITSGKLEVSSQDFKEAANLQAALANINPALKGDKGAEVVGQLQGLANPNDEQTIRMVGYGSELGYGPEGLKKARERAENITSSESLEAIGRNAKAFGMDETMLSLFLAQKGLKQETANIVSKALLNGDFKSAQNAVSEEDGKKAIDDNFKYVDKSRAMKQERYDANKGNAQAEAGNALNSVTSPLKGIYNALPVPIQSGASIAMGMSGYGLLGKVGGKISGKVIGGGGKQAGAAASGGATTGAGIINTVKNAMKATTTTANSADDIANTTAAVANNADEAANVIGAAGSLGKAGEFLGKNSKVIGKAGVGITGAVYGVKAISSAAEGDMKGAAGDVGEGLGSIGGGLAGAKLGAAAGSAILPGAGTAVGAVVGGIGGIALGLLGGKAGRKLGEGAYDAFSTEGEKADDGRISEAKKGEVKSESSLLTRKEKILKKEELLVDRMLGGFLGEDLTAPDGSVRRLETGDNRTNTNSANAQREQFAQQYANGMMGGVDMAGSGGGDADSGGGTSGGGSVGPLKGNNNHEKAFNFFKSRGYSSQAAAGIIGNLMQESGTDLNPSLHQKGGPGRGLAQWTYKSDRWNELVKYAKSKNRNWDDFQTQLEFIDMEMNNKNLNPFWKKQNSSLKSFKGSSSVDNATYLFDRVYERSGKPMMNNRKKYANQVYSKYAKKSYAIGVDRVAEDQLAYLHKDEAVLNRFDAKDYREGQRNSTQNTNVQTLNINLTANESVDAKLIQIIKNYLQQATKGNTLNGFKLNQSFQRRPV